MIATQELSNPAHLQCTAHGSVARARDRFRCSGEIDGDVVRPVIADSWRRCRAANISFASLPPELPSPGTVDAVPLHRTLREASLPLLTEARDLLAQAGTILVLADSNAIVLDTYGDRTVVEAAARMELGPSSHWSEALRGTNAVGTALVVGGPVHVQGAEHYCAARDPWTCAGTVVRDRTDGSVLAAVAVAGRNESFNPHLPALAMATAAHIEIALAARETSYRERLLARALARLSSGAAHGLIVFDRKGRLVTADARASAALAAAVGMPPELEAHLRIGALDCTGTRPQPGELPRWLSPEWMEPVIERDELLGTLAVLPRSIPRPGAANAGLPRYQLRRAIEFIEAELDRSIHIEEVARAAGISRYHFQRRFKGATGQTPHQYILHKRIERAKVLLASSDLPIIEVATQAGFADQSHFTTLFRRTTSMTPKTYRHAVKV